MAAAPSYTPPLVQMAFQGTLYITDKHTCFSVEERGRKLPFKVAHASISKATRQRPARKGAWGESVEGMVRACGAEGLGKEWVSVWRQTGWMSLGYGTTLDGRACVRRGC